MRKFKQWQHAMKIIKFGKKKMISLTKKKYESYLNQINCYIYKYTNDKKYHKVKYNLPLYR